MNPLAIMALVSAAMPLLHELLSFGEQIAESVEAAQGTPAAASLATLQAAHANLVSNAVSKLATAIAPH